MFVLALLPILLGGTIFPEKLPAKALFEGDWSIDLRLETGDPVYSQPMHLEIGEDGVVNGTFHENPILAGRVGHGQGRDCLAFRTSDGAAAYVSSACAVDGKLVGQTWSEGRNFVLPWTAERK